MGTASMLMWHFALCVRTLLTSKNYQNPANTAKTNINKGQNLKKNRIKLEVRRGRGRLNPAETLPCLCPYRLEAGWCKKLAGFLRVG